MVFGRSRFVGTVNWKKMRSSTKFSSESFSSDASSVSDYDVVKNKHLIKKLKRKNERIKRFRNTRKHRDRDTETRHRPHRLNRHCRRSGIRKRDISPSSSCASHSPPSSPRPQYRRVRLLADSDTEDDVESEF